jgi:D-alanyl-D-alanine carboxypeptidase
VAVITLCLLNIFVVSAGVAVVNLTPERNLTPQPPSVAERALVPAGGGRTSAANSSAPLPSASTLAGRLAGPMQSAGAPINAVVIDPATRRTLYDLRSDVAQVPASTNKIVTATAALSALDAGDRLTTKVVRNGNGIVLVGGGDPTLASRSRKGFPSFASLPDLAKRTATALKAAGTRRVRLDYDSSLYEDSGGAPGWKPSYLPGGNIALVTALAVDEGRAIPAVCDEDSATTQRAPNPPRAAAQTFGQFLTKYGVRASVGSQVKAGKGLRQVAAVRSPPVPALVEHMLECSDNDLAEALARQVAIKRHRTPDFAGASEAVQEVLAGLGVSDGVQTYDGSGLSVRNRITPAALARIVALAASDQNPTLRSVITGMPVAGFSGTLEDRYAGLGTAAGAGSVRAKTGTLSDVTTLAGLVDDADGRVLAFAFMVNKVKSVETARVALDRLASAVAACGCRG